MAVEVTSLLEKSKGDGREGEPKQKEKMKASCVEREEAAKERGFFS